MLDILPSVADFLDEPLADASIVPTFLLSRFTASTSRPGRRRTPCGHPRLQLRLRGLTSKYRASACPWRSG